MDAEEVNSGPYSILEDHPANQVVLGYQRWLLESIVLLDSLSEAVPTSCRLRLVVLRRNLGKAFSRMEMWKETEWHRQRKSTPPKSTTGQDPAGCISSDSPVVVDTDRYQHPSWKNSESVNLLLRIVCAVLLLLCRVSIPKCNWVLRSLKVAFILGFKAAYGDSLSGTSLHIVDDVPQDIREVIKDLDLAPVTETFVSCPSCSYLYPTSSSDSTYPDRCTYKRAPDSKPCGRRLRLTRIIAGKSRTFPAGQYVHQDFNHWLGRMLCSPGLEAVVDRDVLDPDNFTPGTHRDVWDTLTFRAFKGSDGKPFIDPTVPEGRYVFGICMDGFNAEGKGGAVRPLTAVYLVWYNLPPQLRFKYEYMYLAGVLCGHPSQEQINHLLRPLVTCFRDSYFHGVWFTSTPLFSQGKLSRSAIIPMVADLLAARQMAGFAPHNHTNFCSLCTQKLGEIEELDYRNWARRSGEEHRKIAEQWRDAATEETQDEIYDTFGVRWSELLRLPYWDPTSFVALDSMHMFYLGDFQRHCEQVWGMGGKYRDGLDGIAYDPEKKPPTSHELKDAVKILRTGSEPALTGLRTEVLRTLCKDNGLRFLKKRSRLLEVLVKFRIDQGWFDEQGRLIVVNQEPPPPQSSNHPPRGHSASATTLPQAALTSTDFGQLQQAFETLYQGNKTAVSRLSIASIRALCQALLPRSAQDWYSMNKVDLLRVVHQFRRENGITDDKDKLIPNAPNAVTAATLGDMAVAEDTLRHGSMTELRRLPTLTLIALSTQNDIEPSNHARNKTQALEQLQDYRVKNGIEREEGGLVRPRNARTRILGRDRMKHIWEDMSKTTYPSWFSPAPPRVSATGNSSGMKADQWRSYCCVHLPISLLDLWGSANSTSREYQILANFMDLVTSAKLVSKRHLTPNARATYRTHMHRYLVKLLELFPGTTISPNQHLSLHWPDVAEKVGPSHATRCFAFEHNNFLLQQIQTNHRVDDLSGTLLRRFCMQQNLRLMINCQELPEEFHDVVLGFMDTFRSKAAMSFLAATLGRDDDLDEFASDIEGKDVQIPNDSQDPNSTLRSQVILPQEIFTLFDHWWRNHQAESSSEPVLPFARMMNQVTIDGVEYTKYQKLPQDSNVVIKTEDGQDWQAGRIRDIFEHTQYHRSQLFLVIDCFERLTDQHALRDPCRAFPIAGGRFFYKALAPAPRIIKTCDVLGHFACIDRTLPGGRNQEQTDHDDIETEMIECLHVLPLDKW
uniref:STE/STE11/BCK1 protein kinase n=1 Tax=Ganoderma boninense TaxID=34458 RepID=A0A5K1JTT1_9APHY|nr:STE/STE11/BCK1 protein kinase [Ganoderma boninense]